MRRLSKLSIYRAAGFSLIEIVVGLGIGMLAVIVILQVFALSEERKRTTTSTGESQSDGVIAFYQLQRDIGQAGYGFTVPDLFNCNTVWQAGGANIATAIPLAPVTINPSFSIIPDADLNTDRVLVMYGNTEGEPQGHVITRQAGAVYTMQTPSTSAFAIGDRVIAAPTPCAANLILDKINATAATILTMATGAAGATLYNLGYAPTLLAYAVRGGNLTVCDYFVNDCGLDSNKDKPAIWVPIASNIVSLKAQYGRDTLTSAPPSTTPVYAQVDSYDRTTPADACHWTRVGAVSLALVARSSQYEKKIVTATEPVWAGTATTSVAPKVLTADPIVLTGTFTDTEAWKHFRYKVFQAVVPIRNIAWMGVPQGCSP